MIEGQYFTNKLFKINYFSEKEHIYYKIKVGTKCLIVTFFKFFLCG